MTDTSETSFSYTQSNAAVKANYFDPGLLYSDPKQGIDFKQLGYPYTSNSLNNCEFTLFIKWIEKKP